MGACAFRQNGTVPKMHDGDCDVHRPPCAAEMLRSDPIDASGLSLAPRISYCAKRSGGQLSEAMRGEHQISKKRATKCAGVLEILGEGRDSVHCSSLEFRVQCIRVHITKFFQTNENFQLAYERRDAEGAYEWSILTPMTRRRFGILHIEPSLLIMKTNHDTDGYFFYATGLPLFSEMEQLAKDFCEEAMSWYVDVLLRE